LVIQFICGNVSETISTVFIDEHALLEGRVLGYVHIRKGPDKVGFIGLFQPFSDAIKRFTREQYFPLVSNYLSYYFSPIFCLFLSLLVWVLIPYFRGFISFELGLLFFCVVQV
jgi:NADH-ubiquinone oxidoreductase chain 1